MSQHCFLWLVHSWSLSGCSFSHSPRGINLIGQFQQTKFSADKIFRQTKSFGGQNFRQQARFSALLSAEILSDKVLWKISHAFPERKVAKSQRNPKYPKNSLRGVKNPQTPYDLWRIYLPQCLVRIRNLKNSLFHFPLGNPSSSTTACLAHVSVNFPYFPYKTSAKTQGKNARPWILIKWRT